jgi:hypothetical protein
MVVGFTATYAISTTNIVQNPLRQGVLHTTLCDKVYQWPAAGWWFSLGTPVHQ